MMWCVFSKSLFLGIKINLIIMLEMFWIVLVKIIIKVVCSFFVIMVIRVELLIIFGNVCNIVILNMIVI